MSKSDDVVYVLRTCKADMTAYGGFKWPERGIVRCPPPDPSAVPGTDRSLRHWDPTPQCGNGLHGLLFGEGDTSQLSDDPDAKWLVVKVKRKNIVHIDRKVKFPSGIVVFCGAREDAVAYLNKRAPGHACCYSTVIGGVGSTVTGGDCSTVTGGDCSTVTGGVGSTLQLRWYGNRYRIATFYVGEDGILPNTAYQVDFNGQAVRVPVSK